MSIEMTGRALTLDLFEDRDTTEPLCVECGEPIRWVLDMMSFKHLGGLRYQAGHARCLWRKEAFTVQRKQAQR